MKSFKRWALAALLIGSALMATMQAAEARHRGYGPGPGAFFGGLAVGAIIGGALAAPYYPGPYYEPYYYGYPAYYGRRCYRRYQPVWNGYGWYRQRVLVCY
jgi:hypothetical protein